MEHAKHLVFNIQKFSINDGPGIRTTVFLKGCPLDCRWCHNPESKSPHPQLMLMPHLCIGCGACLQACPLGLHAFTADGTHTIDRARCIACGACAQACVGALKLCGKAMTVDEIINEVLKDEPFYKHSGGGMTVSGGEPLMNPSFTLALLTAAKKADLHTCIETSGFAAWETVEALLPYVDLFLWDVKESDAAKHLAYTGAPMDVIHDNLRRLDAAGGRTILRCPLIPGYNVRDEHLVAIATLADSLQHVQGIEIEPYHPLGQSKSEQLGEHYPLGDMTFPSEADVQAWLSTIAAHTCVPVKKA